jgi:hypothetical protein
VPILQCGSPDIRQKWNGDDGDFSQGRTLIHDSPDGAIPEKKENLQMPLDPEESKNP